MGGMGGAVLAVIIAIPVLCALVSFCMRKANNEGYGFSEMRMWSHDQIDEIFRLGYFERDPQMLQKLKKIWWDNPEKANKWDAFRRYMIKTLADKGYEPAAIAYACELCEGENSAEGLALLQRLAEAGNVEAMYNLGFQYGKSESDAFHDPKKEAFWYEMASEAGHIKATYMLHFNYETGAGVERNPTKANECLKKASAAGYEPAMVSYAKNLQDDLMQYRCPGFQTDVKRSLDILQTVLQLGTDKDSICQATCELGIYYGNTYIFWDTLKKAGDVPIIKETDDLEKTLYYLYLGYCVDPDSNAGKYLDITIRNTGHTLSDEQRQQWDLDAQYIRNRIQIANAADAYY